MVSKTCDTLWENLAATAIFAVPVQVYRLVYWYGTGALKLDVIPDTTGTTVIPRSVIREEGTSKMGYPRTFYHYQSIEKM